MKVGALAARTGLTVRTLHHYDDIGLLSPSARTPSGHRLYSVHDVARLQHIQALRSMGMSLEEIRGALRTGSVSPRDIVRLQLERIAQHIADEQKLARRLRRLAQHLDDGVELTVDELCQVIQSTHTLEAYLTPVQIGVLHTRGAAMGSTRVRAMQAEWATLIPAMRAHWQRGTPPAHPAVRRLAERWRELLQQLTHGDRALERRLRAMAEGEASAEMPEAGLMEYVGQSLRRE